MVAAVPSASAPDLSVGHLWNRSWETFKANVGLSIGLMLGGYVLVLLVSLIPAAPGMLLKSGFLTGLGQLVGSVASLVLSVGIMYAYLRLVRNDDPNFGHVLAPLQSFVRVLAAVVLMTVIVFVGFLLLVVPGVIVAIGLFPVYFAIVDRDEGAVDTLKYSWDLTNGHKWDLFLLFLATAGINILGSLACGIGVLVSIPVTMLMMAAAYDELTGGSAKAAKPTYPPPAQPIQPE
jgi:uncharacterized membrane protein